MTRRLTRPFPHSSTAALSAVQHVPVLADDHPGLGLCQIRCCKLGELVTLCMRAARSRALRALSSS